MPPEAAVAVVAQSAHHGAMLSRMPLPLGVERIERGAACSAVLGDTVALEVLGVELATDIGQYRRGALLAIVVLQACRMGMEEEDGALATYVGVPIGAVVELVVVVQA